MSFCILCFVFVFCGDDGCWVVGGTSGTSANRCFGETGSSSMVGMFTESGPCTVVEAGRESIHTVPREWGWDRASNMLFLDQVGG